MKSVHILQSGARMCVLTEKVGNLRRVHTHGETLVYYATTLPRKHHELAAGKLR